MIYTHYYTFQKLTATFFFLWPWPLVLLIENVSILSNRFIIILYISMILSITMLLKYNQCLCLTRTPSSNCPPLSYYNLFIYTAYWVSYYVIYMVVSIVRECSDSTMGSCVVYRCIHVVILAQNMTHCDGKQI